MKTFSEYIEETFKQMGKLSKEELSRGGKLKSIDDIREVDARTFYNAITQIKTNDIARGIKGKGLETLTVYGVKEYKEMRCFLGDNNSSGFALHGDELVSVFSSQKSSGKLLVKKAIKEGAKRLDCFALRDPKGKISGPLYSLYSSAGFKIDTSMNSGKPGEAYSIKNGVSSFVNDKEEIEEDNPNVVIFMKA